MSEKRAHKRFELDCHVTLRNGDGRETKSLSLNISNGGMFLPVRLHETPEAGHELDVEFSVPRSTPNTFLLEQFRAKAEVLRHGMMKDEQYAGLAIRFKTPLALQIEV